MAAIVDLSDLINRSTGGNSGTPQNVFFHKAQRIAGAVPPTPIPGRPMTLWTYDGQPSAGVAPGAVAVPTNATAGSLSQASPGGGRQQWMTQVWAGGFSTGTLVLYDRLLHIGGLSATTTSAQTVGGTLTRNTGGVGNMVWVEIYTIIGTTGTTVTASYTNQAGTASRTTAAVVMGGTDFREATRVLLLPLQAGDYGIQAVASVTVLASTGTAGNFGVTVGRPLAYIGMGTPGAGGWRDYSTGLPGIPEVGSGACLAWLWYPNLASVPELFGGVSLVEA